MTRFTEWQTSRFTAITPPVMVATLAASSGKSPVMVAWLISDPSPNAIWTPSAVTTYSDTIAAFHAPPAAVTSPVTK